MPKGVSKKPDHLKAGETPRNNVQTSDDLSPVDLGQDFVKQGETPRANRSI